LKSLTMPPQLNANSKASAKAGMASPHHRLRLSVLRNSALIRLPITADLPSPGWAAVLERVAGSSAGTAAGGIAGRAAGRAAAGRAAAAADKAAALRPTPPVA